VNAQSLVAKVWNFAHVLRDQGLPIDGARWSDIRDLSGETLNATYVKLRQALKTEN
jgi:type I restriction enzyme M protein